MLLPGGRYYYSILQMRDLLKDSGHTVKKWKSQNPYSVSCSFIYFIYELCSYIENTVYTMFCFQIKAVDDFSVLLLRILFRFSSAYQILRGHALNNAFPHLFRLLWGLFSELLVRLESELHRLVTLYFSTCMICNPFF